MEIVLRIQRTFLTSIFILFSFFTVFSQSSGSVINDIPVQEAAAVVAGAQNTVNSLIADEQRYLQNINSLANDLQQGNLESIKSIADPVIRGDF